VGPNSMTMIQDQNAKLAPRRVFMVLSPRSLDYARLALMSLLRNALEDIDLHLITDSLSDKQLLAEEMAADERPGGHRWTIHAKQDLRDHESTVFGRYPYLRQFREGHPCWRKITDPLLLSKDDQEIVILDPDLYFPNRFSFETTPERGLLLMWQQPNCLLPRETIERALRKRVLLAHHVDIGVAHWRANTDLDWLEWLIYQLDLGSRPEMQLIMHIEAIVWAALAMRLPGGYLSPKYWRCWRRTQVKRGLRKLGVPGHQILRTEPF
jgi:hypothetical protein